jgi:hypothetical protein
MRSTNWPEALALYKFTRPWYIVAPVLPLIICEELAAELKLRGFNSAQEAIGSYYL